MVISRGRLARQLAAPVRTGASLPTCPTSATQSDNLQRSLLLYLHQGKVQSLLLMVILLITTFICTLQVPLFSLARSLCEGSGNMGQKRDTLMSI